MKALGIAMVLIAAAVGALWLFGAFDMENPAEAAEAMRQGAKSGMTWKEVAELRRPRKYYGVYLESMQGHSGDRVFDEAQLEKEVAAGQYPDGFFFEYRFSQSDAIAVDFDSEGKATGVRDLATVADLFQ